MKVFKTVIIASVCLFSFWALACHAADVAKIGVIDFQKILENSEAGKAAQEEITREGKKMEADLKKKSEQIEELKNKFELESMVMSKEKREEKEREIRISINDIKTLQKKYRADFNEQSEKLIAEIQKEVVGVVEKIGKEEGYLLIIEKRGAGVVYSPSSVDMTDKVIKLYNAEYGKKSKP